MKKFLQSTTARALATLIVGVLFIVFASQTAEWLIRLCGLAFIIPGLVAIISQLRKDDETKRVMLYPLLGTGSILFGLVLIIWPHLFVDVLMYLLGALLIILAAMQFYTLWDIHRSQIKVFPLLYLFPALVLADGIYICADGDKTTHQSTLIILTGCGLILYALLELLTVVIVRAANKRRTDNLPAVAKAEAK